IITHPVFVEAILHLLRGYSANITVGDDIESNTNDGFTVSGFREMCKRTGVELVNFREKGFIETECSGYFLKKAYFSKVALDADVIVNLPKLKTHSLTVFTGGVKNMYGTIPNGLRIRFHGEYGYITIRGTNEMGYHAHAESRHNEMADPRDGEIRHANSSF
ncbi:MAG: DUF362 domain-containing protein, partial [Desulfobacteraceae bacterium]|nr:DUF362 domain-containing protein [Desulfobacteraceae bacterium]